MGCTRGHVPKFKLLQAGHNRDRKGLSRVKLTWRKIIPQDMNTISGHFLRKKLWIPEDFPALKLSQLYCSTLLWRGKEGNRLGIHRLGRMPFAKVSRLQIRRFFWVNLRGVEWEMDGWLSSWSVYIATRSNVYIYTIYNYKYLPPYTCFPTLAYMYFIDYVCTI